MKKLIAMLMTMAMILSIVGIMPTKTKANSFGVVFLEGKGDKAIVCISGYNVGGKDIDRAKKIIIYKKAENSKKFKKFRTVSKKVFSKDLPEMKIVDKKAKGYIRYRYQPVFKNGKKGKKSFIHTILVAKTVGKAKVKNEKGDTIISFKIKNTSKKYKVKLKCSGEVEYDDGKEIVSAKAYFTNKKGTAKAKKVTVPKNKTKRIYYRVKNVNAAKLFKYGGVPIDRDLILLKGKREYSYTVFIHKNKSLSYNMVDLSSL